MAKEEQAQADAPAEGGGKKKLFIIIGAAVAVALVLGVAAFMMMGKGDKKAKKEGEAATTEAAAGAHGAAAPAAEGGHGAAAAPAAGGHGGAPAGAAGATANIFAMDPFIVNIYDGQELRYLKVKVELEMVSPAIKGELDARLAQVRDSILILLSAKTMQDIQDVQGKNALKDEILGAINKCIPPGKIAKVYFTDFVVQ
jgi:flagellar FliL protein